MLKNISTLVALLIIGAVSAYFAIIYIANSDIVIEEKNAESVYGIILTVLAIIFTIFSVTMGLISYIGYGNITEDAREVASKIAREVATKEVNELSRALKIAIRRQARGSKSSSSSQWVNELDLGDNLLNKKPPRYSDTRKAKVDIRKAKVDVRNEE